jgi:hypothetical protein
MLVFEYSYVLIPGVPMGMGTFITLTLYGLPLMSASLPVSMSLSLPPYLSPPLTLFLFSFQVRHDIVERDVLRGLRRCLRRPMVPLRRPVRRGGDGDGQRGAHGGVQAYV